MKLIVGLGNPGQKYTNNRHNLGYMCLAEFANDHKIKMDKKQGLSRTGTGEIGGETVILARSQTYMNESGQAVRWLVRKYSLNMDDLIIIHDDMDLPPGKIRIRQGGSAAGHNGIKSIISELGSPDFIRVRVGIGRPEGAKSSRTTSEDEIIGFVLSSFTRDEQKVADQTIPKVSDAVEYLINDGLAAAMNKYNQPDVKSKARDPKSETSAKPE
jgi:peptidyl-tRNA hydrolase, PTH1 family